jgi:hypothetical protein
MSIYFYLTMPEAYSEKTDSKMQGEAASRGLNQ